DGKQCACGLSTPLLSRRCLATAAAWGSHSALPGSVVTGDHQTPERSGLPSTVRGVGPEGGLCRLRSAAMARPSSPRVLNCVPSWSLMFNSKAFAAATVTPFCSKAFTPGTATEMSYVPGATSGIVYLPSALLTPLTTIPVCAFLACTVAFDCNPPKGS